MNCNGVYRQMPKVRSPLLWIQVELSQFLSKLAKDQNAARWACFAHCKELIGSLVQSVRVSLAVFSFFVRCFVIGCAPIWRNIELKRVHYYHCCCWYYYYYCYYSDDDDDDDNDDDIAFLTCLLCLLLINLFWFLTLFCCTVRLFCICVKDRLA